MTFHRYSFWAFLFFLIGIAIHSLRPEAHFNENIWIAAGILCAGGICIGKRFRFFFVFATASFCGAWLFDRTIPRIENGLLPYLNQTIQIEGRVIDVGRAASSPDFVRVDRVQDRVIRGPGNAIAIRLPSHVTSTATIRLSCSLKTLSPTVWGRASYLRRGAWTTCTQIESLEVLPSSVWDIWSTLSRWREWLTARIHRRFSSEEAGLLAGMLYGDEELSTEQRDAFRESGLIHLVAVSGANVTLVVSLLMPFAFLLRTTRRTAFWCASCGIVLFLGFVGASAAVLRAGIMGWFALCARETGRIPRHEHLLLCTVVAMCIWNPRILAFDVGFHLSVLATGGLLLWAEPIESKLERLPTVFGFRSAVATSLAVTLALLPYAIWMFGTYSLAGLLTNVIALPIVPWIMFFGAIAVVIPDVLAPLLTLPVSGCLRLLFFLADLGSRLPGLGTTKSPLWLLFATYALILGFDQYLRYPQILSKWSFIKRSVGKLRQSKKQERGEKIEVFLQGENLVSESVDRNR